MIVLSKSKICAKHLKPFVKTYGIETFCDLNDLL